MLKRLATLLGGSNDSSIKQMEPIVDEINEMESEFERFSDDELRAKTEEFKQLISDGATGTYLQSRGLEPGGSPEELNASRPELIREMSKEYFGAGSDMVLTTSFGGSRFMLEKYGLVDRVTELNRLAAQNARIAAPRVAQNATRAASGGIASGTSHPATEAMVAALAGTEHDTGLDLTLLSEIADYFREVRKKYHQFESEFTREDVSVQINQVPGGMMSNLANQLKEQNALDRIREVFDEIPRVRADLGYPPLVTPSSQIVGTQAVYNVLSGERYKTITNEVKRYFQGGYGQAPAPVNPDVQKKAIGNESPMEGRPADLLSPELNKLRSEIGELAGNEEDVLTFAMFPELGREFLQQRADGTLKPEALLPEPVPGKQKGSEGTPTEFIIDVHGETYEVAITGVGEAGSGKRKLYLSLDGMPEETVFEPLNEYAAEGGGSKRRRATDPGHVTTAMPGNVVDVLVKEGDVVKAGQGVMVTEAMKMENEIQANIAGTVKAVYVEKGDRVTPGEVLIEIEA